MPLWRPLLLDSPPLDPSPTSSLPLHHQTNRIIICTMAHRRQRIRISLPTGIACSIDCPLISNQMVTRLASRMGTLGCLCPTGYSIMHRVGAQGTGEQSVWGLLMDPGAHPTPKVCSINISGDKQRVRLTDQCLDTSHVPCKFFRSGQCQAGKACPFSHSIDTTTVDTPCRYFAKVWWTSMSLA